MKLVTLIYRTKQPVEFTCGTILNDEMSIVTLLGAKPIVL
jgi:hypothetical protein